MRLSDSLGQHRRRTSQNPQHGAPNNNQMIKGQGFGRLRACCIFLDRWHRQQRDLLTMSADEELGLMSAMITITANDSSPEMLAAIRRGPGARPSDEELIEYLLTTKNKDQERPAFEQHSLEHVLSFQRRVHAVKKHFFRRREKTPLGRLREWWDRTEAQMSAA